MSDASWYDVVAAHVPLTQGDLIFACPVLKWHPTSLPSLEAAPDEQGIKDFALGLCEDVVVLTQACDLEHGKVENVVLCPHVALSAFRRIWEQWLAARNQNPSEKAWKNTCADIAGGYVWNQTFLAHSAHPGLTGEVRVVDFHTVYTVPRSLLEALLHKRQAPRLRLRAPYREHLSQAFARFFMRVGLPQAVELPAREAIKPN